MKYGLNLLLWTDRMHDAMQPICERIKTLGYDGVEMPIFDVNLPLYQAWGKKLDDLGLERTAVTIRTAGDNPVSPSASVRSAAVDAMRARSIAARQQVLELSAVQRIRPSVNLPERVRPKMNLSGASKRCRRHLIMLHKSVSRSQSSI